MRLVIVSSLAALVLAPIAAEAAQAPVGWSASLTGRVVETYSYTKTIREFECTIIRMGTTRRELTVRSASPSSIEVSRSGSRAAYSPSRLSRVRVATSTGGGRWFERRLCRADPIETASGTCAAKRAPTRVVRAPFRWAGPNRISFRSIARTEVGLCGIDDKASTDGWLHLAPGRVDEEALIAGQKARVVARGEVSRDGNLPERPALVVGQNVRVTWTMSLRRR